MRTVSPMKKVFVMTFVVSAPGWNAAQRSTVFSEMAIGALNAGDASVGLDPFIVQRIVVPSGTVGGSSVISLA